MLLRVPENLKETVGTHIGEKDVYSDCAEARGARGAQRIDVFISD